MADMDFGWLDNVDDDEPPKRTSTLSKYDVGDAKEPERTPDTSPATAQAPTTRNVAAVPVAAAAPASMQVAVRSPEQIELAERVTKISESEIVANLEKNHMDQTQATQCRKILGWAPPDLQDRRVQQYMVRNGRYPHLQEAFENEMLTSFLVGINRASRTVSSGLMMAHISRNLLSECIVKTGASSNSRKKLVQMSGGIRVQIDTLAQRVNEFVKAMSHTNKEMGSIAYLLKYGATVDVLTNKLNAITLSVSAKIDEMDAAAEAALVPIGAGAQYVEEQISSDDALNAKKREVEELRAIWDQRAENARKLYDNREKDQQDNESKFAATEEMLKMVQRQINARTRELERLVSRDEQYDARITRYEALKDDIQNDRGNEMAQNAALKEEAQAAVKEEIKEQQRAIDSQLARLEDMARQYSKDETDYNSQSMTASDGMEKVTTTKTRYRHGWSWLFWWGPSRRTTTTTDYVQKGGNEKKRLENMAGSARTERKAVEREIERLREERSNIVVRVKEQLTKSNESVLRGSDAVSRSRHSDRMDDVQKQIVLVEGLKAVVIQQQQNTREHVEQLEARLGELKGDYINSKRRVDEWKTEGHPDKQALDRARQEEQHAFENFQRAQDQLKQMVDEFGVRNGEDYKSFMTTFRLLNDSLQQLPGAMRLLSQSFAAAYAGFNSDFFKDDFQLLPPEGQRLCLLDATRGMQAIAMVGTDFIDAPLQNMLSHHGSDLITKIIQSPSRQQMIERPSSAQRPMIEEVADDDEAPRRGRYD